MSAEERLVRAHDLGISAFLADTIYNFGELVRLGAFAKTRRYGVHGPKLMSLSFLVDASNLGRVQRDTARVDQETAVHIQ